ncbi:hypothetical protein FZEAL_6637 [Fusarium zealandicum]|uniref:Cytochrome c oxidase-assembly factor COX23, mitochondrial n=1 Tax=Fusarium zealandicum TaxID=1053134 RepID=A0A8H4UHI2_9HYPO|nr:hypothetical protein FZEAL_6637 [Fusarium zealandicum]
MDRFNSSVLDGLSPFSLTVSAPSGPAVASKPPFKPRRSPSSPIRRHRNVVVNTTRFETARRGRRGRGMDRRQAPQVRDVSDRIPPPSAEPELTASAHRKSKSEFYDPCQEAAKKSYKCLFRNGGDKSMCGEYFQAYRDCKQAWTEKRKKEGGGWF